MAHDSDTTVASAAREWLFKGQGQVFGPVPEARLAALLESGEVGPDTEVATEGGTWRRVRQVPALLVHVRRAEARARVESEVTAARRIARRRAALRGTGLAVAGVLLLAIAGGVAFWLASRSARRSALLDDLGPGIAVATVTVGAGHARDADEIAVPDAPPPPGAAPAAPRQRRLAAAQGAPPRGTAEGGDLTVAQYDPRAIQEVVSRRQGSLGPCLRDESRRSPEFAGEIPIEFAVGNDGRVAQLWIEDPRFKAGELRDCLLQKLKEWSFPPFPGERPVVAIAFRINGR